jgi:hypothetical protein
VTQPNPAAPVATDPKPTDPTPAPAVPAPSNGPVDPAPATFDPKSLSPEVQEYIKAQIAAADQKARTTSKANAAKEATDAITAKLAQALGLAPDQSRDPDALAKQLTESQRDARMLRVERAIERAARKSDADEELVTAVLLRGGQLAKLDPIADDFGASVAELVKNAVEANPRLRATPAAPAPAAVGGATSIAMAGPGAAAAQGGGTGGTEPDFGNMSVDDIRKYIKENR